MSTSIDTVRTVAEGDREPTVDGPVARRVVDVSEFEPEDVRRYAREADCGVHFERKGGRTFLVAG